METYLLDANVILRFLRQDHPEMGVAARALFQAAARGEATLLLDDAIVAEVVYVLQGPYKQDRTAIAAALLALVRRVPAVRVLRSAAVMEAALARYRDHPGVDLADALLAALAKERGVAIASFDRDLDRFGDITRFDPLTSPPPEPSPDQP